MSRARTLWAKSSKVGPGHSLLGHLLDVGLVAKFLLEEPRLDRALRHFSLDFHLAEDSATRLMVVLAALHDIGKASPTFQSKWPEGAPPEALLRTVPNIPHGTISAVVLKEWLRSQGMHSREAETLAHAVGVHHGVTLPTGLSGSIGLDSPAVGGAPWEGWRNELIQAVVEAFGPLPEFASHKGYRQSSSWAFLAGLTSVADWIGSGFPHAPEVTSVSVYLAERQSDLTNRLAEVDWPAGGDWWDEPTSPERFVSWFQGTPAGDRPRPLQIAVQDALEHVSAEQFLLVIEAPMGEGKTEAAFFAAVRAETAHGLYIGLPTQATSDALHSRLTAFAGQHASRVVRIALAHGAARVLAALGEQTASVVLAPRTDLVLDPAENEGVEAAASQALWFTMGRRELLAELGVGTVDQALLAVLPTKHHFVRAWALAGKVVVLDEVHAYDGYTFGLLEELVQWLACLGSTVIVMSATLPQATRASLVEAFQRGVGADVGSPEPAHYPRLTLATRDLVRTAEFGASRHSRLRVAPAPHAIDALGRFLLSLQAGGGAVGVIVNTVKRAQALYSYCRSAGADVLLLHAQMPLGERRAREAELLARFGADSEGQRNGLVIATQVMEQSLDVDFDVLVTDLAPIDLLLQRAGRMHRHSRFGNRGPHESAVVHVAGLGDVESGPDPDVMTTFYQPYIMWRSWASLIGTPEIELPAGIDALVQRVYDLSIPSELPERFESGMVELAHAFDTRMRVMDAEVEGWGVGAPYEPASQAWRSAATDGDANERGRVIAPTRLGERTISVIPVYASGDRWRLVGASGSISTTAPRISLDWLRTALMTQMSVRNVALIAKLDARARPQWWSEHKLLRFMFPLELADDGRAAVDPRVRLDPELGLVIGESA